MQHHRYVNSERRLCYSRNFLLTQGILILWVFTLKTFSVIKISEKLFSCVIKNLLKKLQTSSSQFTASKCKIDTSNQQVASSLIRCTGKEGSPDRKIWSSAKQQYNYLIVSLQLSLQSATAKSNWKEIPFNGVQVSPLGPKGLFCGWDNEASFTLSIDTSRKILISLRL